jgi:hypothetical protein
MQCWGSGEQSDPQESPKETTNLLFSLFLQCTALLSPCMGGEAEDPAANFTHPPCFFLQHLRLQQTDRLIVFSSQLMLDLWQVEAL